MVYRRRKFFKKRRNYFTSRRRTFKRFVRRVKKATTAIAEKKYRDFGVNASISTSGALIGLTNSIPTGSNVSERIGNKIRVRYITWRLSMYSSNEDLIFWRIALLRGRTAALTIGDLPTGSNAESVMIDIEKWEIVTDNVFSLGDMDTNGRNKRFFRKTNKIFKDITFDNSSTGTGTVNPYFLYIWCNDVVTTENNIVGTIRTTYVDM